MAMVVLRRQEIALVRRDLVVALLARVDAGPRRDRAGQVLVLEGLARALLEIDSFLEHRHVDLRPSLGAHGVAMLDECPRRRTAAIFEVSKVRARRGKSFAARGPAANNLPCRALYAGRDPICVKLRRVLILRRPRSGRLEGWGTQ